MVFKLQCFLFSKTLKKVWKIGLLAKNQQIIGIKEVWTSFDFVPVFNRTLVLLNLGLVIRLAPGGYLRIYND